MPSKKGARRPVRESKRALTRVEARENRFVSEYLIDQNGVAAAVRAGYSKNGAGVTAHHLLRRPRVAAKVEAALAARAARTGVTADRVLKETELVSFSCVDHYRVDENGYLCAAPGAPEGAMRAVASVKRKVTLGKEGPSYEVEFRLWNKPEVLKLAGKHAGVKGFVDRLEVTGLDGGPLETVTKIERVIVDPERKDS
jgi:phage terminase small subunit